MSKFVVEFSPPRIIKSDKDDAKIEKLDFCMILAPFQKLTQVEFINIKIKESAVQFLTIVNPHDKIKQFILPPPSDGIYFDINEFTLQPNSSHKLLITWQPYVCGNIRKIIKIKETDTNRTYDFVILGNCIDPLKNKLKNASNKSKNFYLIKKKLHDGQKKVTLNKTRVVTRKFEKIRLVENSAKLSEITYSKNTPTSIRRTTFLVEDKENFSNLKSCMLSQDTVFTSPDHSSKHPDKNFQDFVFNKHFKIGKMNSCFMREDSLNEGQQKMGNIISPLDNFCLTPLKSCENLLSPVSSTYKSIGVGTPPNKNVIVATSPFKPKNTSTIAKMYSPEEIKPRKVSVNLCTKFDFNEESELNNSSINLVKETIDLKLENQLEWTPIHTFHHSSNFLNCTKLNSPSLAIKDSPYKCSPKKSFIFKNRLKLKRVQSPSKSHLKSPKLDKVDQYLKCLANPELVHNCKVDPFFKMSQYYDAEWLDKQQSDLIRWLNILLMPSYKLEGEEQSVEQAAMAWEDMSKTCHKNKPMKFATPKDLFVAQIYKQSPQQWTTLRKTTSNFIKSTNVAIVLSKLTVLIEKGIIAIRDDRQIHLDFYLKTKITDLLKCYNPLWLQVGLEAIYGQVIPVKSGSDLDGFGWFIRKNLFNNDFIKKKFTKINVLQVNFPLYNIAMKKFILKKILMLIYLLDCAKEQKLIRHNPSLFKTDSPYKSSHDFLMGFCADIVAAHRDIIRCLRSIDYNLTHKQTPLDEVNYAVKSFDDLRDGTRITRVIEILFKGDTLSQKLRLPAISKLQKIHNVNLALSRISEYVSIAGNITSRDIVNGHKEKILSLFWQIIYKYLNPRYNIAATKIQQWWRNNSLNLIINKRIRTKRISKYHLAAAKIQACVRGYLTRKRWPLIKTELIEHHEKLSIASTKIKRYLQIKLKLLTEERKYFIVLKKTTVYIQRKFRSKIAMKKDQQLYAKIKQSVLLIQKTYRGFVYRKNWPHLKSCLVANKIQRINSINIIKRAFRRNLPPNKDEMYFKKLLFSTLTIQRKFRANNLMKVKKEEFLTLKKAATILQQKFRAKRAMVSQKDHYLKLKMCAVKFQAFTRGYIVRKQWPVLRCKLQKHKMHLINSRKIIKRALRRNLPPSEERIKFLRLKKSVIIVQRRFRAIQYMKIQRKQYLQLKAATIKLQGIVRGYLFRKQWPFLQKELKSNQQRLINCSNIIKRVLKKNLPSTIERLRFLDLRRSVIIIQNKYRVIRQVKDYQKLRKNVIVVQQKFRANKIMKQQQKMYEDTKVKTIILQAYIRGYLVRKRWPETKCMLESNQRQLILASNTLKKFLRQCLPPTQEHLRYLQLRQSVINMQARFRATVAMKSAKNEYILLKHCVVIIQRYYRTHRAMVTQKLLYKRLQKSTVILQAHVRGYIARKCWPQRKNNLETHRKCVIEALECKWLLAGHAFITELNMEMRAAVQLRNWTKNVMLTRKHLQKKNFAASKIQAAVRGFLIRKKLPQLKNKLYMQKRVHAASLIQALWRGYCVRKIYQCRKETIYIPKNGALTLGRRHNDVVNVLNNQKKNEYSYQELVTVFWNLDTCTSLSKELCIKTAEGTIVDYIFHFLQYSNQSQPSIEAREPAIRVLINLLRYHETSWQIWMRTIKADMVKDLIKMMKTCCGKISSKKLYCSLATWIWIALQDPEKKNYIKNISTAIVDLKCMMDTLNKKYKTCKVNKNTMALPSTQPTWSIGSKCQKIFDSDLYAITQVCKLLNIRQTL